MHILIIEDEEQLCRSVAEGQRIHNYLTDRNIVPAATSCGEQIKYFLLRHKIGRASCRERV